MLLAIDTATGSSSVAVLDGDGCLSHNTLLGVNPGEVTVSQIDELVRAAGIERKDLSAVAVGVGPGPYTSTRIGVAIASTLAFALNLPVYGICTHDSIAVGFVADRSRGGGRDHETDFVVATDARRREIYWARYDRQGSRVSGPSVGKPHDVSAANPVSTWVGDGLDRYPELVEEAQLSVHRAHVDARWTGHIAVAELARLDLPELPGHTGPGVRAGSVEPSALPGGSDSAAFDNEFSLNPLHPELVDHDSATAAMIPTGQRLFPAYPLYLRRPDAKLPAGAS